MNKNANRNLMIVRCGWVRALLLPSAPVLMLAGSAVLWWVFSGQPAWDNRVHRLPFESAAWKANSKDDGALWPTRLRMADNLARRGGMLDGLKGRTRAEVRARLGDEDAPLSTRGVMAYHLGPERGIFRVDSEMLVIRCAEGGRVSRWSIETD